MAGCCARSSGTPVEAAGSFGMNPKPRTIGPEDEDRRTDRRGDRSKQADAKKAGVESLPDGEKAAEREATKARDD